jgi:hypothetical protein
MPEHHHYLTCLFAHVPIVRSRHPAPPCTFERRMQFQYLFETVLHQAVEEAVYGTSALQDAQILGAPQVRRWSAGDRVATVHFIIVPPWLNEIMLGALERINFVINGEQARLFHSVEESALLVHRMPRTYPEEYGYRAHTAVITNRDHPFDRSWFQAPRPATNESQQPAPPVTAPAATYAPPVVATATLVDHPCRPRWADTRTSDTK